MNKMPKRSMLHLWIAIVAILFSALAPAISQALTQKERYPGLGEICTVRSVSSTDQTPAKSDPLTHHMKNCPYCATHGGSFALLPPAPVGAGARWARPVSAAVLSRSRATVQLVRRTAARSAHRFLIARRPHGAAPAAATRP
jgi:hypothetical protein